MNNKEHNDIYDKLVKDPEDIPEILAYAIYKREKKAYLKIFKEKFNRDLTDDELSQYHLSRSTEYALKAYEDKAISELEVFVNNLIDEERNNLEKDSKKMIEEIEYEFLERDKISIAQYNKINTSQKYLRGVFQSLWGSVLFVFLLMGIILLIAAVKFGPKDLIDLVSGKKEIKIEDKIVNPPAKQ